MNSKIVKTLYNLNIMEHENELHVAQVDRSTDMFSLGFRLRFIAVRVKCLLSFNYCCYSRHIRDRLRLMLNKHVIKCNVMSAIKFI